MFKKKKILAVIPARGGSKGVPKKNIKDLNGKPLIAWTLEAAHKSSYLDHVVVNTDSPEIARVVRRWGGDVPFLRKKNLAGDKAKMMDVLLDTVHWFEKESNVFDIIMLLQATSPLRTAADIDAAVELHDQHNADAVVSVCPCEHHPYHANTLPKDRSMKNFLSQKVFNKNRQELPEFYRLNGAIYLSRWNAFKKLKSFMGLKTTAYIMPVERSVDIDTKFDFQTCELMMKSKR